MVQLDGLRAFAVISVLLHHYLACFFHVDAGGLLALGRVKLFFVLSGFLITGILLRSRELPATGRQSYSGALKIFYARRSLRIFPLYFFVIACAWIFDLPQTREVLRGW